jgi:copper chaperone
MSELSYTVPGVHCGHCERAVSEELQQVEGVDSVQVDLETKLVTVRGGRLDDTSLRAAIEAAGYEAA